MAAAMVIPVSTRLRLAHTDTQKRPSVAARKRAFNVGNGKKPLKDSNF